MVKVLSQFGKYVVLVGLTLILGVCSIKAGMVGPPPPPPKPSQDQVGSASSEATRLFSREVQLAEKARDRDVKIEHFRKALKYRPGNPDNLAAEFRIAVLLSQYYDPENPQPVLRKDSVGVYEHILKTYEHMDYYNMAPVSSSSDMQFMIPEASIHLACLYRGLNGDNGKARQWTHFAMKSMVETYERRVRDWANEPPSPEVREDDPFGGRFERSKWKSRMKLWQERQKIAKEGDVFSTLEMAVVKAAVRQYGYTFGKQRPSEVVVPMSQIIKDFPGTPMAKVAQGHIERAKEMMFEQLDRDILDEHFDSFESQGVFTEFDSMGKEIFIPKASVALQKKKAFVFDLASGKLLNTAAKVGSEQTYKRLMKLGKGDIAWDGSLVTVRKAKALTVSQESHRPLKCTPGRWCNWDRLPDKVNLPYSVLVVTKEDVDYLITIRKIESDGIRIIYKKLNPDEVKSYLPARKKM